MNDIQRERDRKKYGSDDWTQEITSFLVEYISSFILCFISLSVVDRMEYRPMAIMQK